LLKLQQDYFMIKKILFGVILILWVGVGVALENKANAVLRIQGNEIYLEKAVTLSEQALGLSYRKRLPENRGMLFIFPKAQYLAFWMKDMNFPIEIIWLNENDEVVDISLDQKPCISLTACPLITPKVPAQKALEVNVGFTQKYDVKKGERLEIF
jgi:uncharacterized membrane protein (UPF0127 family)